MRIATFAIYNRKSIDFLAEKWYSNRNGGAAND